VLLVDTYDTLAAVEKVIALARELGEVFHVRGIRIDSGDLAGLANAARARLDAAGLHSVKIVASGGLDENHVADLVREGAPIDRFGVGADLVVSADAPSRDIVYKHTDYAGEGRVKLSAAKETLPGRKQVFRRFADGAAMGDVLAAAGESLPGTPLLRQVMAGG